MGSWSVTRAVLLMAAAAACVSAGSSRLVTGTSATATDRLWQRFAQLPLSFEPNQGQSDDSIDFVARGPDYALFISPGGTVLTLPGRRAIRMTLVGANEQAKAVALEALPGRVNYFVGGDPEKWRAAIPTYAKTTYREVYRGIDVVYYGNQQQLEYDFVVRPGADVADIAVRFDGAEHVAIDPNGDLLLDADGGVIRNRKPHIYQDVDGRRETIAGEYVLEDSSQVGFRVARYDATRPLVIDPVLAYSTFLGGGASNFYNTDVAKSIAVDAFGNAYVAGSTGSTDFPVTPGAPNRAVRSLDAFVAKFNPSGSGLIYATFLGGAGGDFADAIAIDPSGNAYVTGGTDSRDFPTTAGAFDGTMDRYDAFVTKLSADGSALVFSTYLGGTGFEATFGQMRIAVDREGGAYVTGETDSTDFPTTAGAFRTTFNGSPYYEDAFLTKFNAAGALVYSTFLGGTDFDAGIAIAVDAAGNAYIAGITGSSNFPATLVTLDGPRLGGTRDAFVTKVHSSGAFLVYSRLLGGSTIDQATGIAVDAAGHAYVTGQTNSTDFPTTAGALATTYRGGAHDGFVVKLDVTGLTLEYSTYLGGAGDENPHGIAVDTRGNAYVIGETGSTDFPSIRALQSSLSSSADVFVTKLNASGTAPLYSTYLGGSGGETGLSIAVDAQSGAYVAGSTYSSTFPTTRNAFDTAYGASQDGFVAKIQDDQPSLTLTLGPAAATQRIDARPCVRATVEDAGQRRVEGVVVRFDVTGAMTTSGAATTDGAGQVEFCYSGTPRPGRVDVRAHIVGEPAATR
jgi:hypothetical protein